MQAKGYAFEGHVIRLTEKDYYSWWDNILPFLGEAQYLELLGRLDDWLNENPAKRKNWYMTVAGILRAEARKRIGNDG